MRAKFFSKQLTLSNIKMNTQVLKLLQSYFAVQERMLAESEVQTIACLGNKLELIVTAAQMMVDKRPSLYPYLKRIGVKKTRLRSVRNLMTRLRIIFWYVVVSTVNIWLFNLINTSYVGKVFFIALIGLLLLTFYVFTRLELEGEEDWSVNFRLDL